MSFESLLPAGKEADYLTSEYYDRALAMIGKSEVSGKEKHSMAKIVEEVHKQAADGLYQWESKENPGVVQMITRVSALKIIEKLGSSELQLLAKQAETEDKSGSDLRKNLWVVFSTFPMQGIPTDGGTHTSFDLLLNQMIKSLPGVVRDLKNGRATDLEFVALGSPYSMGGRVTNTWIDKMIAKNYYNATAELQAEFLADELKDLSVNTLIATGQSHGASMAELAVKKLEERMGIESLVRIEERIGEDGNIKMIETPKVRVLADEPVVKHGGNKEARKQGKRMKLGAIITGVQELPTRWRDVLAKSWIAKVYARQLGDRAVEDEAQKKLKDEAYEIINSDMISGPKRNLEESLTPSRIPVYVRQGVNDLAMESGERKNLRREWEEDHEKGLAPTDRPGQAGDHVRRWGINKGHAVNRISAKYVGLWLKAARAIED